MNGLATQSLTGNDKSRGDGFPSLIIHRNDAFLYNLVTEFWNDCNRRNYRTLVTRPNFQ
jgi:hypothetical protein